MRESCMYGSARGALSNGRPYRNRRTFISLLGGAATWPLTARAQTAGKVYRVALIFTTSPIFEMVGPDPLHPSARTFVHGLRALGYHEGQNLVLERRTAEGRLERLFDIVTDLVGRNMDVIVAVGHSSMIRAVKAETRVPIVLAPIFFDPVEAGVVETLARPGKNVTGLSITPTAETEAKRLELFKAALPNMHRLAFLGMKSDWEDPFGKSIQAAARQLGVTLLHAEHKPNDYADTFTAITRERPDGVLVANTPVNFAQRRLIVDFIRKNELPAMYSRREYVQAGGLMAYGVDILDVMRRAGVFVHKIVNGANPADLPVEQPTKFELVINLKTAKALGITVPPLLLAIADEVIE
jgi:putative ABC transport system substrate-binding protein